MLQQDPSFVKTLEIRTRADLASIETTIRKAIHQADPNLPVTRVRPLTEQVDSNLNRERLIAKLSSGFALLALALACLGVYGVLSYAITRRTSEIGIRLALGAEQSSVRWMMLREALLVIAAGLLLGVPIAVGATRLVKGLLYGLSPGDPVSLVAGAATLLAIGTAAALLPAWRASRIDPMVALRHE